MFEALLLRAAGHDAQPDLHSVDRFGRRKPLIIGPILMAIFLAWQAGIAQKFSDPTYTNQGVGIAGLASIFLFSGAFSASFGPVSWIYQSEIFPMNQRAYGTAVSTASNWVSIDQFNGRLDPKLTVESMYSSTTSLSVRSPRCQ